MQLEFLIIELVLFYQGCNSHPVPFRFGKDVTCSLTLGLYPFLADSIFIYQHLFDGFRPAFGQTVIDRRTAFG